MQLIYMRLLSTIALWGLATLVQAQTFSLRVSGGFPNTIVAAGDTTYVPANPTSSDSIFERWATNVP
jgi:hypothetical protein